MTAHTNQHEERSSAGLLYRNPGRNSVAAAGRPLCVAATQSRLAAMPRLRSSAPILFSYSVGVQLVQHEARRRSLLLVWFQVVDRLMQLGGVKGEGGAAGGGGGCRLQNSSTSDMEHLPGSTRP